MRSIIDHRIFSAAPLRKSFGTVALMAVPLLLMVYAMPLSADDAPATTPAPTTTPATTPAPTTTTTTAPAPVPTSDSVTGLSAQDVVALTPDAFVQQYTAKSGDTSPAGVGQALGVYYQFARESNRQATKLLPAKVQHVIGDLRDALRGAIDGYIGSEEAIDAGGTLYANIRARGAVDCEVTITQILASLQTPTKDPRGRRIAENEFAELQDTMRLLPVPGPSLAPMWVARYKAAHNALLASVPKLKSSFHQLPDKGAEILMTFLHHQITT